jgi:hypothetical protein
MPAPNDCTARSPVKDTRPSSGGIHTTATSTEAGSPISGQTRISSSGSRACRRGTHSAGSSSVEWNMTVIGHHP